MISLPARSAWEHAIFVAHCACARAIVTVALLAVAGCGGGQHDRALRAAPTATAAPVHTVAAPSHAKFVARLDDTCRGSGADLAAAAKAAGGDTDQLAPVAGSYAKRVSRTLERQQKIVAPPADRRAFARYLATQRQIVGVYQRMAAALHRGDLDPTQFLLGVVDDLRADRTRAAVDLGLRRCGA